MMHSIIKIYRVFCYQLKRELASKRVIVLFLVIGIFIYSNMEPVSKFCMSVGIKATPLGSIFMINDFIYQTVFMIGVVFLLSIAPYRGEVYRYIVYRSGTVEWEVGNILYIFMITFIYLVFIVLMSIIGLKGNVIFSADWGKIWGTLARTNAAQQFGVQFDVNEYIIGRYNAMPAIINSFLLEWVCFIWLGLCMYFMNSISKKGLGILIDGLFIFLDAMIYNSWTPQAYRFSPVTLSQLSVYTKGNLYYGISLNYAYFFYLITNIIWILLIVLCCGKSEDYE